MRNQKEHFCFDDHAPVTELKEELQLLRPFPLGIVTRFQMWNCLHLRLVSKETGKGRGHGVGVEPAQIELIVLCRLGHQFAPDEGPLVVH